MFKCEIIHLLIHVKFETEYRFGFITIVMPPGSQAGYKCWGPGSMNSILWIPESVSFWFSPTLPSHVGYVFVYSSVVCVHWISLAHISPHTIQSSLYGHSMCVSATLIQTNSRG